MRTTLKRGLGQTSIAANGNGRAVLPPTAPTPMRVYRQPVPERRTGARLVGRILLYLLLIVVMLASALVGGTYLFFHEGVAAIQGNSPDQKGAKPYLSVPNPDHATVGMFLGYDRRPNEANTVPSRSDTIMLLRADPQLHAISMLSFPRDMLVTIRCPGDAPYQDKINAAFSNCGSKGAVQTVRALTGLPINYLVTVNFTGFKEIVDRIGGIWIDVDRRYLNTNGGRTYDTFAEINLWPGYQRLKGWQALDYVRFRHTDSDLYRVLRQQQFVRSLKEQMAAHIDLKSPASIPTVASIIGSIEKNLEASQGGNREIPANTILRYAFFGLRLPAGHFFQAKIDGLTGYSYLTTDSSNIQKAVQDFSHPDVEAPTDATRVVFGGKARVPDPEDTTVTVLNGNGIEGSATNAAYLLSQRGYKIVLPPSNQTANAPSFNYQESKVYWNPKMKRAKPAARRLAELFAPADAVPLPLNLIAASNGAMTTVVVGKTFHRSIGPPAQPAPKREPPAITRDPGTSLQLVRSARKKVGYRLEYPTVIEQSSSPDSEVPIRIYRLDKKHKALRLTYRTGLRQYWGIQMTDWEDAPVLSERNFRRFVHGREFDLYYSGAKLHMVVLRENGATYWVVNTLDDVLSNDTMLAIARGLRPLKGKVGRG